MPTEKTLRNCGRVLCICVYNKKSRHGSRPASTVYGNRSNFLNKYIILVLLGNRYTIWKLILTKLSSSEENG